mgnify:CR=1 FL=1
MGAPPEMMLDLMRSEAGARRREWLDTMSEQTWTKQKEAEARQHKAIKHVVSHIFAFAPVHIKLSHYPKNSRKAGETFVWITIDDAAIRKQERALRAAGNAVPDWFNQWYNSEL